VVWYFFVETRGFTLEQISQIFDTEDISWKQRRNFKAPNPLTERASSLESAPIGDEKAAAVVSEKSVDSREKL
jgi:hypothetical protein